MGTAAKVSIIIALCSTNPSVGYEPAPNACPPNVDTALAKPTMIEFPVTLPRVVASAAAAKGTGPRRPTNATEVRLITRLHTMDKLTGSARPAWFLASPTKPPSSVAAFSRAAGDMAPVPETALTSPASKSPSPSSSHLWTSSYPSLLRGAPIPPRIPHQTRCEECRRGPEAIRRRVRAGEMLFG